MSVTKTVWLSVFISFEVTVGLFAIAIAAIQFSWR